MPAESPDGVSANIRDRAFHWNKNIRIFGGFMGTETSIDDRDWIQNNTYLDGDLGGGNSAYLVVVNRLSTRTSELNGLLALLHRKKTTAIL